MSMSTLISSNCSNAVDYCPVVVTGVMGWLLLCVVDAVA
jgi:hypothetical protein